jgi:hypothetical protein
MENAGTGNGFDYYEIKSHSDSDSDSDMEEVNAKMYDEDYGRSAKCSRMCKSVRSPKEWLFDSEATVHVAPNCC